MNWDEHKVLLTGGSGFLGQALQRRLGMSGVSELLAPRRSELDLLDRVAVAGYLETHRPTLILHAAAVVGGIGANRMYPGRFFYENAMMGIQLIEEARRAAVGRMLVLGTICAYPKITPVPFHEDDLWKGYPEETNAPYGLAKKMLLVQLQAYRQEYGFDGVYLLLVNLYGPGDHFDLEKGHVIPAMIRKFVEAVDDGYDEVVLWGDGSPTREFLFVDDAAEGIVLAAQKCQTGLPVNIGRGEEISIRDLATIIAEETGYRGRIVWDVTKPNGQPRRSLDVSRAADLLGFRASTPFRDGLRRTIHWFRETRGQPAV